MRVFLRRLPATWLALAACTPAGGPSGEGPTDTSPSDATDPDATDSETSSTETSDTGSASSGEAPDYTRAGPYTVTESGGTISPSGTCTTPYTVFTPASAPLAPHVVLAHGFSRTEEEMADLARHVASWGLVVGTQTMCHATPLDNDPEQDAADLRSLSARMGGGPVLYAGHSAGGQRSVLAAAGDPDAVAVLGLDPVDVFDLALDAAPTLAVPLYGLVGEPSSCNSDGNGVPVLEAAAESAVIRVTDADHCDFEDPTDLLCTLFCEGDNPQFDDDQIKAVIRGMSTAFLLWRSGLEPRGADYWTSGRHPYDDLLSSGRIRLP